MVQVKIKSGKYGQAIAMLLQMGEGFQTRFQRTLIVNSQQRRILEEAGFVATNGAATKTGNRRGEKAK
jgi:hypothetical protein